MTWSKFWAAWASAFCLFSLWKRLLLHPIRVLYRNTVSLPLKASLKFSFLLFFSSSSSFVSHYYIFIFNSLILLVVVIVCLFVLLVLIPHHRRFWWFAIFLPASVCFGRLFSSSPSQPNALPPHLYTILPSSSSSSRGLGSVGTREGVIQKNLSGLLPVRDLHLDPSLLYSLPLLALSPNLLVVWIFLSVAYFLAKVRCSWETPGTRGRFLKPVPPRRRASHDLFIRFLYITVFCLFLSTLNPLRRKQTPLNFSRTARNVLRFKCLPSKNNFYF